MEKRMGFRGFGVKGHEVVVQGVRFRDWCSRSRL